MSRLQFDIKYRPQIESGEYKVFAYEHEEQEARIICWDNKGKYPIIALIDNEPEKFDKYGRVPGGNRGGEFSLFIITPEQEEPDLTGFESGLFSAFSDAWQQYLLGEEVNVVEWTKEHSAELLSLAREEFAKEYKGGSEANEKTISAYCSGYEAGKAKALDDLDGTGKVHCKSYDKGYDCGKKEALKDLPRWKKIGQGDNYSSKIKFYINGRYLEMNDTLNDLYEIALKDLEKLPKEDEK